MCDNNSPSTQSIADYLAQLLKDRKQLAAFPNVFMHMERLLDEVCGCMNECSDGGRASSFVALASCNGAKFRCFRRAPHKQSPGSVDGGDPFTMFGY
ncbi:Protein held out wings [Papilio xuthus]|uniref:Protein held out wings n=1 Tax=Papilio xuthus TaxID=66420 RepID=A0A194Q052_PAPXU|nr:Protein held out wings [Papilio xuthus]